MQGCRCRMSGNMSDWDFWCQMSDVGDLESTDTANHVPNPCQIRIRPGQIRVGFESNHVKKKSPISTEHDLVCKNWKEKKEPTWLLFSFFD